MFKLGLVKAREHMPIALMLEYQKSVNWHTLSRLRPRLYATGSRRILWQETTGSAPSRSLHGWVFID
jgi:hypothetical protein